MGLKLVVLRELPRTRDTLLLRLMGAGKVLQETLADLAALDQDAWEREVAMAELVAVRMEIPDNPTTEEQEYLMDTQEVYEQWRRRVHDEGFHHGLVAAYKANGETEQAYEQWHQKVREQAQRNTLLKLLGKKFGPLPDAVVARVHAADETQLELWTERVLTAATVPEVFGHAAGR